MTSTGLLRLNAQCKATGNWADILRQNLNRRKPEAASEWLARFIGRHFPRFSFSEKTIENVTGNYSSPVNIQFSSSISNAAGASGTRIFFNPNLFNRITSSDIPDESADERQLPVSNYFASQKSDSVAIKIPLGYSLEAAPKEQSLVTPFGSYHTSHSLNGRTLTYIRQFELTRTQIDTAEYGAYLAFLKKVSKNDKAKFVFKR